MPLTYILVGEVMALQTLPDCGTDQFATRVANVAGFSLHAGVAAKANERATKSRCLQANQNDCVVISQDPRYPQSGYR